MQRSSLFGQKSRREIPGGQQREEANTIENEQDRDFTQQVAEYKCVDDRCDAGGEDYDRVERFVFHYYVPPLNVVADLLIELEEQGLASVSGNKSRVRNKSGPLFTPYLINYSKNRYEPTEFSVVACGGSSHRSLIPA